MEPSHYYAGVLFLYIFAQRIHRDDGVVET